MRELEGRLRERGFLASLQGLQGEDRDAAVALVSLVGEELLAGRLDRGRYEVTLPRGAVAVIVVEVEEAGIVARFEAVTTKPV